MAAIGQNLLKQQRWGEAEQILRACLSILEAKLPNDWSIFHTKSLLGDSLLRQGKHTDAEPLIIQGYEGLKARETRIPASSKPRLNEAGERVVQLYEAWGKTNKADEWRKRLAPPHRTDQAEGLRTRATNPPRSQPNLVVAIVLHSLLNEATRPGTAMWQFKF